MLRLILCSLIALAATQTWAAERHFDFSGVPLNEIPPGFRSTVSGLGKPGDWKMILDDAPSAFAPLKLIPSAEGNKRAVLAQLSTDSTDEHFPILVLDDEVYGDFTFTTKFKTVKGVIEQMAGIVFRFQDETNYYYVRASSLGNTFRFFKVVNGQRSAPVGPEVEIPRGEWHELSVQCLGNQIRCLLNGKEIIPLLTDNSFKAGKVGFWTKSDSVSYFTDAKIVYTPREVFAKVLLNDILKRFPRIEGLKIYATPPNRNLPEMIASNDEGEIGAPADKAEQDVIARDVSYFGRGKQSVTVTMPLHDRNGETVGAVKLTLKSFPGQTEQNALARALPIVKEMEGRIRSAKDLFD